MKLLRSIKTLRSDFGTIVGTFVLWKALIFLSAIASIFFLPLHGRDFLGGGYENYVRAPWFFGWANFDGEHYLSIAAYGYKSLEQQFFPMYPLLMNFLAGPFHKNFFSLILAGLLISNLSFFISLVLIFKLIRLDYSRKVAFWTVFLILSFPTSFFFGSVYSESLFLCLTSASFYLARREKLFIASFFGTVSSVTRVFGILLLPALLLGQFKKKPGFKLFTLLIIPMGLLIYMYFQWKTTGDPLAFYTYQTIVGPQHVRGIVLWPQVIFRYIKILLSLPIDPLYLTYALELVVGVAFFLLPIFGIYKKIKWSYLIYCFAGFLLPTLQGSFSSLPRYVIVLFPSFLVMAIYVADFSTLKKIIVFTVMLTMLVTETMLFIRGYWVA